MVMAGVFCHSHSCGISDRYCPVKRRLATYNTVVSSTVMLGIKGAEKMNGHTEQSRRLVMRLIPQDLAALDQLIDLTSHTSRSDVIRGALTLLLQIWIIVRNGCRIELWHQKTQRQFEVYVPGPMTGNLDDSTIDRTDDERSATFEMRLSPADCELLTTLLDQEAGKNRTEIVRLALGLYLQIVSSCTEGWQLIGLTQCNDRVNLLVPGLVGDRTFLLHDLPNVSPEPRADAFSRDIRREDEIEEDQEPIWQSLPQDIRRHVRKLAGSRKDSMDNIVLDLIRSALAVRLGCKVELP
jgi:Arc/MetJ-type ribon-helix-helix transcriptional regulator